MKYDFTAIEKKWQANWEQTKPYAAITGDTTRPKFYGLIEFPYPSGQGLHVGHPRPFTAMDIVTRKKRMEGYNVLFPIGFDAFGLPTENYAIKNHIHPAIVTKNNIANFTSQLKMLGYGFDWDRCVDTTDPNYYKWTQWIFLQMYKHGLAYKSTMPVNWCTSCKCVLANEEVVNGVCERCGSEVIRKEKSQWMLAITKYAQRLIDDLDDLDYIERVKIQQKNWIGRSTGAEVTFKTTAGDDIVVYTTRPDTLFGATYMVLSPEHEYVTKWQDMIENADEVNAYVAEAAKKSDFERSELNKEKTGVEIKGIKGINPVNGKQIPIFISDYVLVTYGTGAIMAVPAHDDRDWEFAKKFGCEIIEVVEGGDIEKEAFTLKDDTGIMVNSEFLNGMTVKEAIPAMKKWLVENGIGTEKVNYKLRDWVFSRQRYWGEPIPLVNCPKCGWVPLPEDQLPLVLPQVESYEPTDDGESPLSKMTDWVNTTCPCCGGPAKRETDTMPQWAGSSWYYLRYCDPHNDSAPIGPEAEQYWGYPDFYIGGAEHAVLHLLYARFWHKVLYDCGIVKNPEPFKKLFHQGIILGQLEYTAYKSPDGKWVSADKAKEGDTPVKVAEADVEKCGNGFVLKADKSISVDARSYKMSKSRGNVVNPDDIIRQYGADALRLYEMFLGPLEDQKPWNTNGIEGVVRFLRKVWREFIGKDGGASEKISENYKDDAELLKSLNETIKKVGESIETLRFNTAISQMMIFMSVFQKKEKVSLESARKFVQLLAPFAPHIGEELWERLGGKGSVAKAPWPVADEKNLQSDTFKMAVQVNGKLRGEIVAGKNLGKDEILSMAKSLDNVANFLSGKTIVKEIYVPGKIVNIVAK